MAKRSAADWRCAVEGCASGPHKGHGYCGKHYQRFKKYGVAELPVLERPVCAGPQCVRTLDPVQNKTGLCGSHYKQQSLGKPLTPLLVATKDLGRPPICSVPDCGRPHKARGYCKAHNDHIKKGREPGPLQRRDPPGPCSVDGCESQRFANTYCIQHNSNRIQRWRTYGLTPELGIQMYEQQGRACGACQEPSILDDLSIDHDHSCCPRGSCGECVRGLLCLACNLAAGHAKDNAARLRALADYLERTMLPD